MNSATRSLSERTISLDARQKVKFDKFRE